MNKLALFAVSVLMLACSLRGEQKNKQWLTNMSPSVVYTATELSPAGTTTIRFYALKEKKREIVGGVRVVKLELPLCVGVYTAPKTDVVWVPSTPTEQAIADEAVRRLRGESVSVWGGGVSPAAQPVEKFQWLDMSFPPVSYVTVNPGHNYPYYHATSFCGRSWYGGGRISGGRTYYGRQGPRGSQIGGGHNYRGNTVGGGQTVRGGVVAGGQRVSGGATVYGGSIRGGTAVSGGVAVRGGFVGGGHSYRGNTVGGGQTVRGGVVAGGQRVSGGATVYGGFVGGNRHH